MRVVFDSVMLSLFLNPSAKPPKPVDRVKARIDLLIDGLSGSNGKVLIPAPGVESHPGYLNAKNDLTAIGFCGLTRSLPKPQRSSRHGAGAFQIPSHHFGNGNALRLRPGIQGVILFRRQRDAQLHGSICRI